MFVLAEPEIHYRADAPLTTWVEVLVDCPGAQGLFNLSVASVSKRPAR